MSRSALLVMLPLLLAQACAPMRTPENPEPAATGNAYQAQYRDTDRALEDKLRQSASLNTDRCVAPISASGPLTIADQELLSRGDLVSVRVADDPIFTGDFVISRDGTLKLPHLSPLSAQGSAVEALQDIASAALVQQGYYNSPPRVSIRVKDFAAARVYVSGAVFEAGPVSIGGVSGDDRDDARQLAEGSSNDGRSIIAALRAAGGIRPDADLSRIVLIRGGDRIAIDLRSVISGGRFADLTLIAEDAIEVPSRNCFQDDLMAVSAISPPGAKIYLSNLTQPAAGNSVSAIGKDVREMPYGSRLSQVVFGMNCVGGAALTNADRWAVLLSRNPITGASVVTERRIEDLLRRGDRDEFDPYLLPGDAVACYDSAFTNFVEIVKGLAIVSGTGALLTL